MAAVNANMAAVNANMAAVNANMEANFKKSPAAFSLGRDLNMTDKKLYYHGTSQFAAKNELL
jgi:hypothetical protein